MSFYGIKYFPDQNTLSLNPFIYLYISLFWFCITILAAANCYIFSIVIEAETVSFLDSLSWSSIRWCIWIFFTPAIFRLTCGFYFKSLSRHDLLKKMMLMSITLGVMISFISASAQHMSPEHNGSFGVIFYLSVINEIPLSGMVMLILFLIILTVLKNISPAVKEPLTSKPLIVTTINGTRRVLSDSIIYIQAAGNFMELHTQNGDKFLYRSTLKELYGVLDKKLFIRVHRSFIINRNEIIEVKRNKKGESSIEMTNGSIITVSRGYARKVRSYFSEKTLKHAILQ